MLNRTRRTAIALGLLGATVAIAASTASAAQRALPQGAPTPSSSIRRSSAPRSTTPTSRSSPADRYVYRETDGSEKPEGRPQRQQARRS